MFSEFLNTVFGSPYLISISIIGILGLIFFLILPYAKKIKPENYLSLMLLTLVFFYEIFATYLNVDKAFNQKIHELLFDVPFQGWNLWSANLFYSQISKVFFLLIILNQAKGRFSQKFIKAICIFFISICIGIQLSGIEPLYGFQPIISLLGNTSLIIACGLFFIDLLKSDYYLELDPLKMWIFWFITVPLFQSSLIFLAEISYEYLAFHNLPLYYSLFGISQLLYVTMMIGILLKFIDESHMFSQENLLQHA